MSESQTLKELLDKRYDDRGGYDGLVKIFSAAQPYEFKLENVKLRYRVSRSTATDWYKRWRRGL